MLLYILNIIAPVFMIIGTGFLAVRRGLFAAEFVDGLMKFSIHFAVPCLLFRATSQLDLDAAYNWGMMAAYYIAAATGFGVVGLLAHFVFGRSRGESIAIGFGALFSNLVLIGLPISQRAWGEDNMDSAFAIVSVHAPFCYLLGISAMEILCSDGRGLPATIRIVLRAMFRNSLMIGIVLGFMVNLSGIALPEVLVSTIDTLGAAALPVALFGIGGVLTRYRLSESMGEVGLVTGFSLLVHPGLVYLLCLLLGVPQQAMQSAVLMASVAPGINAYLFASMYQNGMKIAASAVLVGTVMSVFSVSAWLWFLN